MKEKFDYASARAENFAKTLTRSLVDAGKLSVAEAQRSKAAQKDIARNEIRNATAGISKNADIAVDIAAATAVLTAMTVLFSVAALQVGRAIRR